MGGGQDAGEGTLRVAARYATEADIATLVTLYRRLEKEMVALHAMWPLAGGLDEPVDASFRRAVNDPDTVVLIGEIDGYPLGFLLATIDALLVQADGERVGSIRLIYVEDEAREVAVGEEMREMLLGILREQGITKFDAHVLPGHRLAKNFFEAGGFSARSIIMHHDDDRE